MNKPSDSNCFVLFRLFFLIVSDEFLDFENYYDHVQYYLYNFSSFMETFFSMYALSTKVNHPNLWLKIYEDNMWAPVFFMIFSFFTIFLIMNIIVTIFYITCKRHYSRCVFELGTYERADRGDYARIIAAASNEDGLVSLGACRKMCKEFLLKGPEYLDYIIAKQLQKTWENKQDDKLLKAGIREVGCKDISFTSKLSFSRSMTDFQSV